MKKVILLGLVLNSWFSNASIIVTKSNRGLFGYKSVNETVAEGMHTLTCSDPGHTKCKAQLDYVVDGTLTLTSDEYNTIEATVDKFVVDEQKERGNFVFNNECYVVYQYNPDTDTLVFTIYSLTEAKQKNLIQ